VAADHHGFTEITIAGWNGAVPKFSIEPPVNALSLAIYDKRSTQPIWTVVSKAFSPVRGEVASGVAQRQSQRDDEPRTDLRRIDLADEAGSSLSGFVYGSTPDGFHQIVPTNGAAPPLVGGAQYVVVVTGARSSRLTFKVP
jgi:hypothetical protein